MTPLPFRIKICGVANLDDATNAIGLFAEAIGLNFYPRSKRCIDRLDAGAIALFHSTTLPLVGVFVNQNADEIRLVRANAEFAWIQLHGDESAETLKQIKAVLALPIIRAFRWSDSADDFIDDYLQQCSKLNCLPDAILIDSFKPGEFGGTGQVADWNAIARWREGSQWKLPLVLAGGLTPENVGEAIRNVRPDAVDTASGVEKSPREKDAALMKRFIENAREAYGKMR